MIKDEIDHLLNNYIQWLKDKTIVKQIESNWVEITTPHLDRHNDCLQIYARKTDNGYELTDDGYIIADLINSGCSLEKPRRKEILSTTLAGFGVDLSDNKLFINATSNNFSLKKHNILQAMLAVNDLFYLATPHIESFFMEDVANWFDLSDIRYTPKVKFVGRIGYDHLFDFVIPKSRRKGERIVHTLSSPQKNSAENLVFKWVDTKETRDTNSSLYVFLNDSNENISSSVIEAFRNYDIRPVLWSERDKKKNELAA
jgi:hypothetical protein